MWSPPLREVKRSLCLRFWLLRMRASATARMGAVERKFSPERDDRAARIVLLELEDVGDVRAAPAVDRLIGIADDADVRPGPCAFAVLRAVPRQERGDDELGVVGVLVLVDEQVLPALVALGADVLVLLQQLGCEHQQVVEVDGAGASQGLLVRGIDPGDGLGVEVHGAGAVRGGVEQLILGVGDRREHAPCRPVGRRHAQGFDRLLAQGRLVPRVVDRELGLEPGPVGVLAEQACAQRVERGDGQPAHAPGVRVSPEQVQDALAHLPRGLVGEGQRQDRPGRHAHPDQVRDAAGDHTRLAGTRGGQHEQRPLGAQDGAALRFGQADQEVVGLGCGRHAVAGFVRGRLEPNGTMRALRRLTARGREAPVPSTHWTTGHAQQLRLHPAEAWAVKRRWVLNRWPWAGDPRRS
jgi:hypothetical protein